MTSVEEPTVRKIGRYEVIRKIATGGMAELFLARFVGPGGFEKRCALKRILPQFAADKVFTKMFLNEARVTAMFDHPNLVQIFELGQDDAGQFYIAMELVNGMNLRQLIHMCKERGLLIPPELAAYVATQALDGLAYAHDFKDETGHPLNLVHRDVSPQNILVSYEGAVKVVDFGIVKGNSIATETQAGMLKGKVAYMSPEQASGEPIDGRSDLFSVGVCMYELITGEKPFTGPNEIMCLKAILEQAPPPITRFAPDCPEPIERIVYKALAKQREDRYHSARQFQIELHEVLKACPTPLGRHVIAEYLKSLTEAGTTTFDATRLRIPTPQPAFDASGIGFASSYGSLPPLARSVSSPGLAYQSTGSHAPMDPRQASGSAAPIDPRLGSLPPFETGRTTGDLPAPGGSRTTGDLPAPGASLDAWGRPQPFGDLQARYGEPIPQRSPTLDAYEAASGPPARATSGWTPPATQDESGLTRELAAAGIRKLNPLIVLVFAASALAGGLAVWLVTRDDNTVVVEVARSAPPVSTSDPRFAAASAEPKVATTAQGADPKQSEKAEAVKAEAAKAEALKTEAAKAEAAKMEAARTDAAKAEAAKAEAARAEAAKAAAREALAKEAKAREAAKLEAKKRAPDPREATTGTLTLNSTPRGLIVLREADTLGKTPLTDARLPAGTHNLRLVNKSLGINKKLTVRIAKGQATTENVVVGKGTLKVNSRPWSEVYVDGVSKGKTPLETAVYEGAHEVRLVSPEAGGERIQKVEIQSGQTEDIRVKF